MKLNTASLSTRTSRRAGAYITFAACVLVGLSPSHAATINALTAAYTDVSVAVSQASDGDTVVVPGGTVTWRTTLQITKNITLIGAGTGSTVIIDEGSTTTTHVPLINFTSDSGTVLMRISGFTFQGSTNPTYQVQDTGQSAVIGGTIISTTPNLRIDNCYFNNVYARALSFSGSLMGVIDHCTFYKDNSHWSGCIYFEDYNWKNVGSWGDNSWADDPNFGTNQALYIEDNTFSNFHAATCVDSVAGARWVFRHNTVNSSNVGGHGTDTSGRRRGTRMKEVYQNTFNAIPYSPQGAWNSGTTYSINQQVTAGINGYGTNTWYSLQNGNLNHPVVEGPWWSAYDVSEAAFMVHMRSGTALVWGNTANYFNNLVVMDTFRVWLSASPWGFASGVNVWDQNSATLFDSGKHTGANGANTLTDNTKNWTTSPQQWLPPSDGVYIVKNTTSGNSWEITGNTATSLILGPTQTTVVFNTGDVYEIHELISPLDGNGRGKSDLISGGNDSVNPTPTTWPHNALEPIRVWANTITTRGNPSGIVGPSSAVTKSGREFYYSTDNSAALSGYTPYTYPHPLTGGSTQPSAPTNLRVSGQ